jgi:hypothetical protein
MQYVADPVLKFGTVVLNNFTSLRRLLSTAAHPEFFDWVGGGGG